MTDINDRLPCYSPFENKVIYSSDSLLFSLNSAQHQCTCIEMSTSANNNKGNHLCDLSLLSCYSADWSVLKDQTGCPITFTLPQFHHNRHLFLGSHCTASRQVVSAVTHHICFVTVNLRKSNFDQNTNLSLLWFCYDWDNTLK